MIRSGRGYGDYLRSSYRGEATFTCEERKWMPADWPKIEMNGTARVVCECGGPARKTAVGSRRRLSFQAPRYIQESSP